MPTPRAPLDGWLDERRWATLDQETRQALQRYAEALRQLRALTRQLRRAQRRREPEPLVADARDKVRVAAAVERVAYQQAVQLLRESGLLAPDDPPDSRF